MGEKERPNRTGSRGREVSRCEGAHAVGVTISHTFPSDPRDTTSGVPPGAKLIAFVEVSFGTSASKSNYIRSRYEILRTFAKYRLK